MEHKAQIGSISSGTLLTEDLVSAFSSELNYLTGEERTDSQKVLLAEAAAWLEGGEEDEDDADREEEGSQIVSDLQDALDELAPPYCYFGATEDDGAYFGFWPDMAQIEELPQVENSDEAKELGEDCKSVNDHGNVTVYGGDGSVIIDFV